MNPAAFTLNNNRTAMVIYAIIMIVGIQTFFTIGRLEYPEFTIRNAVIITPYPGRTTVQVEKEVTEALEQSIRQMAEVKEITSTSKPGVSIITVELLETYFDLEDIWSDLRNRVAETQLPDGAREPMVNDEYGDVFPYIYALTSDGFSNREMREYAESIQDEILALDGVAKVDLHGVQDERIYLEFSPSELQANNLTLDDVTASLSAQNTIATSGDVRTGRERIDLVTLGEFESIEELANYPLAIPGEALSVRVSDIFDVRRGYVDPPDSVSHFQGENVICIAVSMMSGEAVTKVGESINDTIDDIQQTLPIGLDIETMFYQPVYVEKSIRDFIENLGQAFFFVILVMFLFAGWRISLVVGVLVPSAILMCFTMMPTAGVVLEMMSIAALIIALGLLVDNAVVVSEQILVRLNQGSDPKSAVIDSVKGLVIPLMASSATTIAAFSPIALASGATSEFTFSLFVVVSFTLISSWILSLTIIPLFCFWFLRPLKKDTLVGRGLNALYRPYESLLRGTLKLRWTYPIAIFALTMFAGWGFQFVPSIFFPPNERGQFVIDFELPLGTDISETEAKVKELEDWLTEENPEIVRSVSAWIGDGGPRWYLSLSPEQANPNYSLLSVLTHTEDPTEVANFVAKVNDHTYRSYPDARVLAKALENGPPVGDPIQLRLYGEDLTTLYDLRDKIIAEIKDIPGLYDIRDDWGAWTKQISVDPDPVRSARLGLTTSTIASALELQFSGRTVTNLREGEESTPIVMRSQADFREEPQKLQDLPIFSQVGVTPLAQVADTSVEFLPGSILREDTVRLMTIKMKVRGRFASEALADIQPRLSRLTDSITWPRGYRIEYGGELEESADAQGSIAAGMPISLAVLSLILIAQFNSLRQFTIIILTIPPMLCGVVPGLILTGSSFGFMTLLGLIALLGIIVNNAILLLDETNLQLGQGKELVDGIVDAAKSRLRPIIMTTVTTIIGLAPLAISGGGMWSSMAYAMMFGLGFATVLTLLLCPTLYFLFYRKDKRYRATNEEKVSPVEEESTEPEEDDAPGHEESSEEAVTKDPAASDSPSPASVEDEKSPKKEG
ncbi:MAG: efflux RND transporter permease subunit [Verrucomicrobiota bacterium]